MSFKVVCLYSESSNSGAVYLHKDVLLDGLDFDFNRLALDKDAVLLIFFKNSGNEIKWGQLSRLNGQSMSFLLNSAEDYTNPVNADGTHRYFLLGIEKASEINPGSLQGFTYNNLDCTFTITEGTPHSYLAYFRNTITSQNREGFFEDCIKEKSHRSTIDLDADYRYYGEARFGSDETKLTFNRIHHTTQGTVGFFFSYGKKWFYVLYVKNCYKG